MAKSAGHSLKNGAMGYVLPSKEELLSSIRPDMKLSKNLFKRTYGYSITDSSFSDKVIAALEVAGCSNARQYYEEWLSEYEMTHDAELKCTAMWLRKEYAKEWMKWQKGGEEKRKREEMELLLKRKKLLLRKKLQILTGN